LFRIAKAIRFAADQGAQVINMSFGTLDNSQALKSAITYAQNKGVVLVASAGNNNTSSVQYPASYTGVIATAAQIFSTGRRRFRIMGATFMWPHLE